LVGVANGGWTGRDVYATWTDAEGLSATVVHNGVTKQYRKETLSQDGVYTITLSDELGNTSTVNFIIDKEIRFTILANNQQATANQIRQTNKNIVILENDKPLTIQVIKDGQPIAYTFGLTLFEDGNYQVTLWDEFSNSLYFSFTIDSVPPVLQITGTEQYGLTSNDVSVSWDKEGCVAELWFNGIYQGLYNKNEVLNKTGQYRIVVTDQAGNSSEALFEIDNEVSFSINTFSGGVTNEPVIILDHEWLVMELYRNGELISYNFGDELTENGNYELFLADRLGNFVMFPFTILTKAQQTFIHTFPDNVEIISVLKNGEPYELTHADFSLYFVEEGNFQIEVFDSISGKHYTFVVRIDRTPPTLELVGVKNGQARDDVTTRNLSKPATIRAYRDGVPFDYKIGDVIRQVGHYRIVLTDEAGNQTEYEFEKIYAFNAASIAIIGGMLALGIVGTVLVFKARQGGYFVNPSKKKPGTEKKPGKPKEKAKVLKMPKVSPDKSLKAEV
jgi:hypothetical protein